MGAAFEFHEFSEIFHHPGAARNPEGNSGEIIELKQIQNSRQTWWKCDILSKLPGWRS